MPKIQQEIMHGSYAVWVVAGGGWWAVSLEADGTVVHPDGPLPWAEPPCLN